MMPLMLAMAGLALVNGTAFSAESLTYIRSLWIGIPLALAAVGLWVWFVIANEAALAVRPDMPSGVWSALILIGGGVPMLAFYPIGATMGLFQLPQLGFGWDAAGSLYLWAPRSRSSRWCAARGHGTSHPETCLWRWRRN